MIVVASAVYMGARVVMSVVCAATARCVDVNTVISFALYPAVLPETFDAGVTQGRETGGSRETSMTNCNKASQHGSNDTSHASPRRFIILSSPKSGTTWVQMMLNTHPHLWARGEMLLEWSRSCRGSLSGCKWTDAERLLQAAYAKPQPGQRSEELKWLRLTSRGRRGAIGLVVMYDQLPTGSVSEFSDWVWCNDVSVIHLQRSATIESFWTLQAETYDFIDLGTGGYTDNSRIDISHKLSSNSRPLMLDPVAANTYVRTVETARTVYTDALRFYPRGTIKYHALFYEDINPQRVGDTHPVGSGGVKTRGLELQEAHLDSLLAFLQVPLATLDTQIITRIHPHTCQEKIANWQAVARALKGTTALTACVS